MLLCNSESCSAMLYYCWNPVLFNKNLLGMKQEMSEVCTVTVIRQSLFQLASPVSSPSSLSVTSCLVSVLFPGVPSQVVASGLRPGPERSPQAFNGCIHNVRINGEAQDLSFRAAGGAQPQGVEAKVIRWGRFRKHKSIFLLNIDRTITVFPLFLVPSPG